MTDLSLLFYFYRVMDLLRGKPVEEWDEVEKKVEKIISEKQHGSQEGHAAVAEFDWELR